MPLAPITTRYYLSSADVDDETGDLTQRVQEAAGAALAEANERLMEAELKVQAAQVGKHYRLARTGVAVQFSMQHQYMPCLLYACHAHNCHPVTSQATSCTCCLERHVTCAPAHVTKRRTE
jgi:hypothetical protein